MQTWAMEIPSSNEDCYHREGGGGIMRKSLTAFGTQGEPVVHIQEIKPLMSGTLWSSHAVSLLLGEGIGALQKTESEQTFKSFFNHPLFIQEVPWTR